MNAINHHHKNREVRSNEPTRRGERRSPARYALIALLALLMVVPAGSAYATPNPPDLLHIDSVGVDNNQPREIHIFPRNALKLVSSQYSDEMRAFDNTTKGVDPADGTEQTHAASGPPEEARTVGETHDFKIMKITPTANGADLSKITPTSGYDTSTAITYYVQTIAGTADSTTHPEGTATDERAIIYFPHPSSTIGINAASDIRIKDGAGKVFRDEAMTDEITDGRLTNFAQTVSLGQGHTTKTGDGIYLIQLIHAEHAPPWYAVVELPTLTQSAAGSLPANTINYTPTVFPKVMDGNAPAFSSYVDVINRGPTPSDWGEINTRILAADADWTKVPITKNTVHIFTAAMTLNSVQIKDESGVYANDISSAWNSTGSAVFLGFGLFEAPADYLTNGLQVKPVNTEAPGISGFIPVPDKRLRTGNEVTSGTSTANQTAYVEIGVLVSDRNHPEKTKYQALQETTFNSANGGWSNESSEGLLNPTGNYGGQAIRKVNNQAAAFSTDGNAVGTNGLMPGPHIVVGIPDTAFDPRVGLNDASSSGYPNLYQAVSQAILGADYIGGDVPTSNKYGHMASVDWRDMLNGYTDIKAPAQLFSIKSPLKIEICVSFRGTVIGSAFRANDESAVSGVGSEDFKPLLYGATNGLNRNSGTYGSGTVSADNANAYRKVRPQDFFSWDFVNYNSTGNDMARSVEKEASVYTGAVSAIKLDGDGLPLAGARFALMKRTADGKTYWAKNLDATNSESAFNSYGPTWVDASTLEPSEAAKSGAVGNTDATATSVPGASANMYVFVSEKLTGRITFDGLAPGGLAGGGDADYAIIELAAPQSYKIMKPSTDLLPSAATGATAVARPGVKIDPVPMTWNGQRSLTTTTNNINVMTKVINVPTLALPNTGGPGLIGIICAGILLIAIGVFIKRRGARCAPANGDTK